MREFLSITKALSDENRVRALMALEGRELCVCQIIELLGLAPSTVSKHMAVLHQAGLVETRKDGRWVYYRLAEEPNLPCVRQALTMTMECLAKDGRIHEDAKTLKAVRKMTREQLCRHYKAC
jgi:DNA-binding transcriptional ArsR family regulator